MTTAEALDELTCSHPPVLHLNGKTSTGKSTFAAVLQERLGYAIIDLDQIMYDDVISRFHLEDQAGDVFVAVYKTGEQQEWLDAFVEAVTARIEAAMARSPVIIDGAIANLNVLKRLYAALPPVEIVYLHPVNLPAYERNLTSRFMQARPDFDAHLPNTFWGLVPRGELERFYKDHTLTPPLEAAIHSYAALSAKRSAERLAALRQAGFKNLLVVDI